MEYTITIKFKPKTLDDLITAAIVWGLMGDDYDYVKKQYYDIINDEEFTIAYSKEFKEAYDAAYNAIIKSNLVIRNAKVIGEKEFLAFMPIYLNISTAVYLYFKEKGIDLVYDFDDENDFTI